MSFNPANWAGDCTFGAVAFLVDEPSALTAPRPSRTTIKGVRPVPYSSPPRVIIQVTGQDAGQMQLQITILTTDFYLLEAKVSTFDTLTLVGDTARTNVLLDNLTNIQHDMLVGLTYCTAVFIGG